MNRIVQLTPQAELELDKILAWLTRHTPEGAKTWLTRWNEVLIELSTSASELSLAPESEGHTEEIRHVIFKTRRGKKYRALFVVQESDVFVIHLHGPGQDFMAPDDVQLP